jgi:HD-GYP domain-containing protein (c-di-GMP phosphodiesterase class II)
VRRVRLEQVKAGMIVAQPIYASDGRLLIAAGVALKDNYLKRLESMGIRSLVIEDPRFGSVEPPDLLSKNTRKEAMRVVAKSMENLRISGRIDIQELTHTVKDIVDDIFLNRDVIYNFSNLFSYDDYTLNHSVNVSVLSILLGISMDYPRTVLQELGIGALLHDVGKIYVDKNILNKPGIFTSLEFEEVKKHTIKGYETLISNSDISKESAIVALQHHERFNGTGYPFAYKEDEIDEFARLTAIGDTYDALIADRIYRKGFPPDEALDIIKRGSGIEFDHYVVPFFLTNVAKYPVGSLVALNNGRIGMVVKVKKEAPEHPIVRVLKDQIREGELSYEEIDLSEDDSLSIVKIIDDTQMP